MIYSSGIRRELRRNSMVAEAPPEVQEVFMRYDKDGDGMELEYFL